MTPAPTGLRHTLPARCYTDPVWFAAEMDRIFASMWICAARREDVAAVGSFVRREVAGASVLIVGGDDGRPRAFHNVCRHRGTLLCEAAQGTFRSSIQCPYHAWTYGLDGRLLGAPGMDGAVGFERSEHGLRQVGCDTWDGHVFVHLDEWSTVQLPQQLGALRDRFAVWEMGALRRVHRTEYDVRANWKLIVQNYNECLHCPLIHPLLNRMHDYLSAENVPSGDTYCGGAMALQPGMATLSVDGQRRRPPLPKLPPSEHVRVHYFAIYPNLLLTLHPDYVLTTTIWPEAPGRTRLVSDWLCQPDVPAPPGSGVEDIVEFWDVTNREDWTISERSQRGIESRGYQPGPYSPRETQLWEFDQFVRRQVGDTEDEAGQGKQGTA